MSVVEGKETGKLSFFIRQTKHGVFTKFLFNAPKERIFSITGPYGRGLNLTEKSSGYYILIAG
jgi:NAD(P)H-flavin reductase